jgi:hypothetical protein
MATWLAWAGFLALIGLPLLLTWGMPRIFRGHHDDGGDSGSSGGSVGYDSGHSGAADSGGGDAGGGSP